MKLDDLLINVIWGFILPLRTKPKVGDIFSIDRDNSIVLEVVEVTGWGFFEDRIKIKTLKCSSSFYCDEWNDVFEYCGEKYTYINEFITRSYKKLTLKDFEDIKKSHGYHKPEIGMYLYEDDGFDYKISKIISIGRGGEIKCVRLDKELSDWNTHIVSNNLIPCYYKYITKDNVLEIEPRLKDII